MSNQTLGGEERRGEASTDAGDAVEEVGVEPAEVGALPRGPRLDDGVQVLLEVGRAGAQRRLQLPPRPGVGEPLHPQEVPRGARL